MITVMRIVVYRSNPNSCLSPDFAFKPEVVVSSRLNYLWDVICNVVVIMCSTITSFLSSSFSFLVSSSASSSSSDSITIIIIITIVITDFIAINVVTISPSRHQSHHLTHHHHKETINDTCCLCVSLLLFTSFISSLLALFLFALSFFIHVLSRNKGEKNWERGLERVRQKRERGERVRRGETRRTMQGGIRSIGRLTSRYRTGRQTIKNR